MTFRFLNKQELQSYVASPAFGKLPHLPITAHRAESHWMNPKVTIEHPLLLLAEEEGELLGYLGVMPEWVYGQQEAPLPCGWLTCMWVSAKARGRGLAGKLLVQMNEAYDSRVLLVDFVPATVRVYEKTEAFTAPLSVSGFRGYVRFDLKTILSARYPKLSKYKSMLGLGDRLLNGLTDLRFRFKKEPQANHEEVTTIDAALKTFINAQAKKASFGRDSCDVQWMMDYPWVLNGDCKDPMNERYEFSAVDTFFKNYAVVVRDNNNQIIGFLLLTHRNQHLKIPHAYFNEAQLPAVAQSIQCYIRKHKINTFTIFQPALVGYFRLNGSGFIFRKTIYRSYIFSKGFAASVDIDQLSFQDGDGDGGFT